MLHLSSQREVTLHSLFGQSKLNSRPWTRGTCREQGTDHSLLKERMHSEEPRGQLLPAPAMPRWRKWEYQCWHLWKWIIPSAARNKEAESINGLCLIFSKSQAKACVAKSTGGWASLQTCAEYWCHWKSRACSFRLSSQRQLDMQAGNTPICIFGYRIRPTSPDYS